MVRAESAPPMGIRVNFISVVPLTNEQTVAVMSLPNFSNKEYFTFFCIMS